jgi:membrane-associated phospholipid phosphatase
MALTHPVLVPAMKQLNEIERILTVFGVFLVFAALSASLTTEITARNHLAEYRRQVAHGTGIVQQGSAPGSFYDKHVGFEQQTLASRWSIPDGHATLGAGFAMFGVILIAVPRASAKKRTIAT